MPIIARAAGAEPDIARASAIAARGLVARAACSSGLGSLKGLDGFSVFLIGGLSGVLGD